MRTPFLSSEEYDEQAHRLYEEGRYDEALSLLREGIGRFPTAGELHAALGYVRMAREEFPWARESFEEALALDSGLDDAWVGLGEAWLKFGRFERALASFGRVDEAGGGADGELGLAIGRALYREGLLEEARARFELVVRANPDSADARAALGFALHALGETEEAARTLEAALELDPEQPEAGVHLGHLLCDRGDLEAGLALLEAVPPEEHWDAWTLQRILELRGEDAPGVAPFRDRLAELDGGAPDPIERLLAEVEAAFVARERSEEPEAAGSGHHARPASPTHRVRTADGSIFTGTWEEIVFRMRDELADPGISVRDFMTRAAERVRRLTGRDLPCDDAEAFVRASARIGLLRIEG